MHTEVPRRVLDECYSVCIWRRQCEWWSADSGMLMFPLRPVWGTRWLDLQPPGWSPSLHRLPLWSTLTSTGRSAGSQRGHGAMVDGVCGRLRYRDAPLGSQTGPGGSPREEGPSELREASGRITERLKCFLCGWKEPQKISKDLRELFGRETRATS